ncbi:MAG: mechanosensitive ion channel family protein [Solirubrobacteraceae bacterium]
MPHILADSFLGRHDHTITAVASVVLALIVAALVDRALTRAYRNRPRALRDPALDTRLRFLRRMLQVSIVVLGIAIALSQFTALDKVAASVLASGAIAAAIFGFAARQTLANGVAGMLLAITQPLRVGDIVTFEGETGTVEDVRLTATYLLTGNGARIVIPNERLAGGVLRNDTLAGPNVTAEASVWIGHDADEEAAIAALEQALPEASVAVADVTEAGVRLVVAEQGIAPGERGAAEAGLRRRALGALRTAAIPRPAGGTGPPG